MSKKDKYDKLKISFDQIKELKWFINTSIKILSEIKNN